MYKYIIGKCLIECSQYGDAIEALQLSVSLASKFHMQESDISGTHILLII